MEFTNLLLACCAPCTQVSNSRALPLHLCRTGANTDAQSPAMMMHCSPFGSDMTPSIIDSSSSTTNAPISDTSQALLQSPSCRRIRPTSLLVMTKLQPCLPDPSRKLNDSRPLLLRQNRTNQTKSLSSGRANWIAKTVNMKNSSESSKNGSGHLLWRSSKRSSKHSAILKSSNDV